MNTNLSKEYIRNRLHVNNLCEDETYRTAHDTGKRYIETRGLSSDEAQTYIMHHNGSGIKSRLIRFAFAHKEKIKRVPLIGKKMLEIKERMLKESVVAENDVVDLSPYFCYYKTDFVAKMYEIMMGRVVDDGGMFSCLSAMRNGASKGAIIYILATSAEFADRMKILHIDQYEKEFKHYLNKNRINRVPILGRLISVFTIKGQIGEVYDRIERLEEVSKYGNSFVLEKITSQNERQEEKISELSVVLDRTQANIDNNAEKINEKIEINAEKINEKIDNNTDNINKKTDVLLNMMESIQKNIDAINNNLSEKVDLSLAISTTISEKMDELPSFIANIGLKNKSMVTSINGGVIAVNADDFIFGVPSEEWGLAMFLSTYGHFEYGTETLFENLLSEGMTVVDIGANLGMFTLRALRRGCNVYAYEPTPSTFGILNQNIKANGFAETGRFQTYNLGVSEKHDYCDFAIVDGMCGHNSIFEEKQGLKKINVEFVSIDEHLKDVPNIDIIKMDIEGSEYFALKGMKETISKNPHMKIIMEFGPAHLKRANVTIYEMITLIENYGFQYRQIDETSGEIQEISRMELENVFSVNLLLERKEEYIK